MDSLYILFGAVTFVAVLLLIGGVYSSWQSTHGSDAKRIKRRLSGMTEKPVLDRPEISIRKNRLLSDKPLIQRVLLELPGVGDLDQLLMQSGTSLNLAQFLMLTVLTGGATTLILAMLQVPMIIAVALGTASAAGPLMIMVNKRRNRIAQVEKQLPDALDLMSRALRAGHALPSAIKMVSEEVADPLGGEFRIMYDEINYGVAVQDALKNLSVRVPGIDLGYFVVAALIQRETGGNLTELLTNIASIVRERLKLFGAIKVLSAEGRLSGWILTILPFALTAVLQIVNPDFMKVLWTDPVGQQMLIGMSIFMVIGIVWMRKLIRLRV